MKVYKCDKCEKENADRYTLRWYKSTDKKPYKVYIKNKTLDLCEDCASKFV
jgi:DNA-directed RNA polymerase subunit RPC12/RpoP